MTADIVTARTCAIDARGVPYPVDPRTVFVARGARMARAPRAYAVFSLRHLAAGATVAARWTFPAGLSPYVYWPGRAYAVFCSYVELGPPGRYGVAVLVNGRTVNARAFIAVTTVAPAPATGATGQTATLQSPQGPAAAGRGKGHSYGLRGRDDKDKGPKGGDNGGDGQDVS